MIRMKKEQLLCFISQNEPICTNKVCKICAVHPWNTRCIGDSPLDDGLDIMHRRKYAIVLFLERYEEKDLFEVLI